MDADGEHDIKFLNKFEKKINQVDYDLIIANRYYKNRISEKIISIFTNYRLSIKDPLSGFKLYKLKTFMKSIRFINKNNFLVDYISFLIKKNYKVTNINYDNKLLNNRKSRIGNNLLVNIRIIFMMRHFF